MQEHVAAEIRAIVTDDFLREHFAIGWVDGDAYLQALVLCAHLRADRIPEAIYAHGVILGRVQRELVEYGAPDEDWPHIKLLELLCGYIEQDSYLWQGGQWQQRLGLEAL
jgi:hypothetical protein